MTSSLASCLNTLFPLRGNPGLAPLVLGPILPGLDQLTRIEFHFSDCQLACPYYPKADAVIWWQDVLGRRCLSLLCWNYVNPSYGTCGGFRSRYNSDQDHCLQMHLEDPQKNLSCFLYRESGYWSPWDRLAEAGIKIDQFRGVRGCPFRGPFNQIMRMFLLAAALRDIGEVDLVEAVSVGFRANRSLNKTPVHLASLGDDIVLAWNQVVRGVPELRYVFAEELVAGYRRVGGPSMTALGCYLEERYGLSALSTEF